MTQLMCVPFRAKQGGCGNRGNDEKQRRGSVCCHNWLAVFNPEETSMRRIRATGCIPFAFASLAFILASVPFMNVHAANIADDFSYPDSAAFESVYTLSNTAGGAWNASFDGSKMTVSSSTPATGAFDHFYARRSIGSVTGDFNASLDRTWNSANEGGERARISLHLLKGDGTGVHTTSLPQNAPWTFANDAASAGMWNDYGINAVTLLINGLEGEGSGRTAQFPWRPGPGIGTGGAATVSLSRAGGNLTATYNDGTVTRSQTVANADEFTHIGIWYSHFTGFPGQFDGSATYTIDNLVFNVVPEPASAAMLAVALAGLALVSRTRSRKPIAKH
jgi:hypothetical protein